jgi:photosystem II stability/assembly factor-like uncharacterized protein
MKRRMLFRAFSGCLLLILAMQVAAGRNVWTSSGPEGAEILALSVPPEGSGPMYAVTAAGTLFRSATGGEPSWVAVGRLPVEEGQRVVLAANPENANLLYAAVSLTGTRTLRMFRSGDQGETWSESPVLVPGVLMDLTFVREQVGFLATLDGLFVTRDGGESWTLSLTGDHRRAVAGNGAVYVIRDRALFVSTDLGESWRLLRSPVSSLAMSPSGKTMFVGYDKQFLKSRDGGVTWQQLPPHSIPSTYSAVTATDDQLFVTTAHAAVFVYDDSVAQWLTTDVLPGVRGRPVALAATVAGPLYAGTEAGVFMMLLPARPVYARTEAGAFMISPPSAGLEREFEWRSASKGMQQGSVRSMALGGEDAVYVATGAGLFRSEDRGESWKHLEGIDDPRHVAATAGTAYVSADSGIHRSSDDGETWSIITPRSASWIGSSSQRTSTLYAYFADHLGRSRDGGTTWTTVVHHWYFAWGVVDPDDSERIYVHTTEGWDPWSKLYRIDERDNSSGRAVGPPGGPYVLNAAAVRGSILQVAVSCEGWLMPASGCGVATSVDGGVNWSALRLSGENIRSLAIDPVRPWRSYAGTASGRVYHSEDFGNEWRLFGDGLSGGSVRNLAISPEGDRIYAGTAAGVFVYEISPEQSLFELLPEDPQRLPRLMDQLLAIQSGSKALSASGLLIPAAGRVRGAGGVTFHTDVTLANGRATEQDLFVAWLPQGNASGANVSTFRLTLPAAGEDDDGVLTLNDVAAHLERDGLGSLLVFAVDKAGNVDGSAVIDGFARIRSRSECGGWVSQSLAAVPADAFSTTQRNRVIGLRHEPSYRTNVGIVNLSPLARSFTVIASGEGASEQFTISVPAFTPVLAGIPNRNYGPVTLTVIGGDNSAPSVSYGSSVDNASGDAWAALARPIRTP